MKTAIVTGGTSGLGLAAAQTLAEKGLRVYALSRHGAPVPGVTSLACDITDADAVERTVAAIEAEAGRIDLVVNNAGFGISGAVECTTPEEVRRLFDVDFFGVVNVNHAVLPRMRRAGGGRIVHVSSVAAPVAIPFQAYYSAAKAAINAYSSALRCEVAPFGIDVVEPLWGESSQEVMADFLASGLKTVVVTTMDDGLGRAAVGRVVDRDFVASLPAGTDPNGENGEYHTFCYDGPIFASPVPFRLGTPFSRSYDVRLDDGTSKSYAYWFADLREA